MFNTKHVIQKVIIMFLLLLGAKTVTQELKEIQAAQTPNENIVLEFASISDIHLKSYESIEQHRFEKAIELSYQHTNSLDAVIINGDFTDGGHDPQYARFNDVIDRKVTTNIPVIVNLGNHENGRNESDSHTYFSETMGYGIDHVFNVNGYYFITLGVHYGDRYLDAQAIWLQSKLAMVTKEKPNQPVFVLIHYPAYQTTANSLRNGRNTFKAVMEQYPQVVNISGHSHSPLQDPRMIHQEKFTSFNNGSLSYLYYEKADFEGPQDSASSGHFAIIKVTESNKVIIEKHIINDDDITQSIKLDHDYIIDIPAGIDGFQYKTGWYDNGTKPYFPSNAQISLTKTQNRWLVSFDQAIDDHNFVYYYHIYVRDVLTHEVVKVIKPNSLFYRINPPVTLSREFSADLMVGKSYEIEIIAISVTNRTSTPLKQTITVK